MRGWRNWTNELFLRNRNQDGKCRSYVEFLLGREEERGIGSGVGVVEVWTGDDGVEGSRVGTFHGRGSSFMVEVISLYEP